MTTKPLTTPKQSNKSNSPVKFTTDLRERFLTLLERGDSIEDACADVGISRATVTKWAAKGRKADAPDDGSAEFAFRLDEIKDGANEKGLAKDDLVRLLEKSARHGSVRAIQLLLERPWEKKDVNADPQQTTPEDPFEALQGDELSERRAARGGSPA